MEEAEQDNRFAEGDAVTLELKSGEIVKGIVSDVNTWGTMVWVESPDKGRFQVNLSTGKVLHLSQEPR